MIADPWHPTAELRWSQAGKLQQKFSRKCWEAFDMQQYGGHGWRSREFFEHEWRDVPQESQDPTTGDQR